MLVGAEPRTIVQMVALRAGRPLRFLQIGSNDGVSHDPLHPTVHRFGWSGVLVEPLPWLFERLRGAYSGVAGLAFENAAVGTATGHAPIFYVTPAAGDPSWIERTASLRREVVLKQAGSSPTIRERIEQTLVRTVTLKDLVERHSLRQLDLLRRELGAAVRALRGEAPLPGRASRGEKASQVGGLPGCAGRARGPVRVPLVTTGSRCAAAASRRRRPRR
jgi:FkbM family methyltransferase